MMNFNTVVSTICKETVESNFLSGNFRLIAPTYIHLIHWYSINENSLHTFLFYHWEFLKNTLLFQVGHRDISAEFDDDGSHLDRKNKQTKNISSNTRQFSIYVSPIGAIILWELYFYHKTLALSKQFPTWLPCTKYYSNAS